jgi:ubiquinone/menaquinone biosynthesis C-methylase UbiE
MTESDNKAKVQAFFGANASMYTTSTVHAQGGSLARLVGLAAPMAHDVVLDIATGAGHNALSFAPHVQAVVATDLTPQMLAEACSLAGKRGVSNVSFCQGDAEHLPFASNSFAVVTSRIAPHHFPDVAAAVREMARVCRRGGCVAIADNITPEDEAAAAYINAFETLRDPSHHWAYSLTQWRLFFQQAGLTLEAEETLIKPMHFVSWTDRTGLDSDVVEELRQQLFNAPALVRSHFHPRVEDQEVYFNEIEGLFIGRKS